MQLFSALSKLISGEPEIIRPPEQDDRSATRPMEGRKRPDEWTRPSRRIRDEKWLRIQKAIDQAG